MTWLDDLKNFGSAFGSSPVNVLHRVELPDGEILGVVESGGTQYYARFNHYRAKWTTRLTKRQKALIAHDWEIEQEKVRRAT